MATVMRGMMAYKTTVLAVGAICAIAGMLWAMYDTTWDGDGAY